MKPACYVLLISYCLVILNSCKTEIDNPLPVADFSYTQPNLSAPSTVTFINKSINAEKYSWDFGDHTISAEGNPKHTYIAGGTYTVTLIAMGQAGTASSIRIITVLEKDSGQYFIQVKKIIQDNCMACHSSAGIFSGRPTAFDTDIEIVTAHSSIKAAIADPATPTNKRMPEGNILSPSDIDIIIKWFDKGGKSTD